MYSSVNHLNQAADCLRLKGTIRRIKPESGGEGAE